MATRMKKAQDGSNIVPIKRAGSTPDLRTGQYKRLGRLSAKNPTKAKKVAKRMVEKATRTERGEQYLKKNVEKFMPGVPEVGKKGVKVRKKMAKGGSFPDLNKDGKVTKKDILIGKGVLPKTAKKGTALKKQAAKAIAMKKAGKAPKKMMGGGKCRYGC